MENLLNELPMQLILLVCAAFSAGLIDSIAGGGGLILVPSFILAGLPPQSALAQEKVVSTFGTVASIINFMRTQKILWKIVLYGIISAILGAYLGAKVILFFDEKTVGKIVIFLLPLAIIFNIMPKKHMTEKPRYLLVKFHLILSIIAVCFVTGFYDGFFGPGTGSIMIMLFHYLLKMELLEASATSKIFNFASNLGALVAFIIAGKALLFTAIPMIIANIFGNYLGSKVAINKGDIAVRVTLLFSLALLFISLIYKYFCN